MVKVDQADWFIQSGRCLVTDPRADKYLKQVSDRGVQVQSRQESKQTVQRFWYWDEIKSQY